jgi:hypothetical protein
LSKILTELPVLDAAMANGFQYVLDIAVMEAIEDDSIVGSCCVLGVPTNVASLQVLEFIRS